MKRNKRTAVTAMSALAGAMALGAAGPVMAQISFIECSWRGTMTSSSGRVLSTNYSGREKFRLGSDSFARFTTDGWENFCPEETIDHETGTRTRTCQINSDTIRARSVTVFAEGGRNAYTSYVISRVNGTIRFSEGYEGSDRSLRTAEGTCRPVDNPDSGQRIF